MISACKEEQENIGMKVCTDIERHFVGHRRWVQGYLEAEDDTKGLLLRRFRLKRWV